MRFWEILLFSNGYADKHGTRVYLRAGTRKLAIKRAKNIVYNRGGRGLYVVAAWKLGKHSHFEKCEKLAAINYGEPKPVPGWSKILVSSKSITGYHGYWG